MLTLLILTLTTSYKAGANGTAPTLSPSEQDVSEGRVPLSSDNDDSEEPGVALPRFLHSDEEETETTTSVQVKSMLTSATSKADCI